MPEPLNDEVFRKIRDSLILGTRDGEIQWVDRSPSEVSSCFYAELRGVIFWAKWPQGGQPTLVMIIKADMETAPGQVEVEDDGLIVDLAHVHCGKPRIVLEPPDRSQDNQILHRVLEKVSN